MATEPDDFDLWAKQLQRISKIPQESRGFFQWNSDFAKGLLKADHVCVQSYHSIRKCPLLLHARYIKVIRGSLTSGGVIRKNFDPEARASSRYLGFTALQMQWLQKAFSRDLNL